MHAVRNFKSSTFQTLVALVLVGKCIKEGQITRRSYLLAQNIFCEYNKINSRNHKGKDVH